MMYCDMAAEVVDMILSLGPGKTLLLIYVLYTVYDFISLELYVCFELAFTNLYMCKVGTKCRSYMVLTHIQSVSYITLQCHINRMSL